MLSRNLKTHGVSPARTVHSFILLVFALVSASCSETREARGSCAECEISLDELATIGGAEDPVALPKFAMTVYGPGGYYSAPTLQPGSISIHDTNGAFARALGQEGGGPGEFKGPLYVLSRSDSLQVVDLGTQRWATLDSDGRPVRTTQFPALGNWLTLLNAGQLAVAGVPKPGPGNNKPLHIIATDGSITSFGPEAPQDSNKPYQIAPARDGGLWTLQMLTYKVAKWSVDGKLERTFTLNREWFTRTGPNEVRDAATGVRDRGSRGFSIWERPDGLWIVLSRVRASWEAPDDIPLLSNGYEDPAIVEDKYEGVIEVLDPITGSLKATVIAPKPLRFINDTLAYSHFLREEGEEARRIFKVSMQ